MRVGFGYDVHALTSPGPLILGGVTVPYPKRLAGHSDGDVLLHAICDALLGASALGDIGRHFPDTDPTYAGISSLILLRETRNKVERAGYRIVNIDATIVAQRPRLSAHLDEMGLKIAEACRMDGRTVNVKATTTEFLGFEGREEGIAAYAVALVEP